MTLPGEFPPDSPAGRPWFALGVNYPYVWTHGCDIGPNQIAAADPSRPNGTSFGSGRIAQLRADFERLRSWGCQVVRIWAFEQGEGLRWRQRGADWIVAGIDPAFLDNVRRITALAEETGLRIYWTLLTAASFEEGEQPTEADRRRAGAFQLLLRSDWAQERFFLHAVHSFADALCAHRGGVFALDLMNEPDMLWPLAPCNIREALSRSSADGRAAFEAYLAVSRLGSLVNAGAAFYFRRRELRVLRFLRRMALSLRAHLARGGRRLLLSIGFAYINTITRNRDLLDDCLDFHDFHSYDLLDVTHATPNIPRWTDTGKACIIGECGLGGQFVKDTLGMSLIGQSPFQFPPRTTLQDIFRIQAELVRHFMSTARQNGFGGCLIWEYGRQFERVFGLERSLTERGTCRLEGNARRMEHCLDWADRIPLLWKQREGVAPPSDQCVHLGSSPSSEELCGRPAVRDIRAFSEHLTSNNLRL
ncbi:hypothetical protein TRIP_B250034 [uncultured Desulfatiglans sp.]|nr:hypothetical protein TRIP_B250034 [uncultured Desulfatiglans sp.]